MCCSINWKKILSFALTFAFGLLTANIFQKDNSVNTVQDVQGVKKNIYKQQGTGEASCNGISLFSTPKLTKNSRLDQNSLKILSKPRANYTNEARENNLQGTVALRVVFLDSGKIGKVSTINGLPHGLTEQAMAAAMQIKFSPATKKGKPVTATKTVQYSFTIY